MYSCRVSAILISMIVTGAARSVAVELFFQLGFTQPLFVTLLYLFGQTLALAVYLVERGVHLRQEAIFEKEQLQARTLNGSCYVDMEKHDCAEKLGGVGAISFGTGDETSSENDVEQPSSPEVTEPQDKDVPYHSGGGSVTGLTERSRRAVAWIHSIPYYAKPLVPGFFNLCNSAMRWTSLLYVKASVAEMLISGMELVLSVIAARLIRKREISAVRWVGVGLVALGVVLVGEVEYQEANRLVSETHEDDEGVSSGTSDKFIGNALILGQCVMSVLQDLSEELFMQEAKVPATLLLGMEGLFGLVFGILLYNPLAHMIGASSLSETFMELSNNQWLVWYAFGLIHLVTITGIFNILATSVTSSMTRNVWKNLRTALVWVFALLVFYTTKNGDLGEEWVKPGSIYTLCDFLVIVAGIYTYYTNK